MASSNSAAPKRPRKRRKTAGTHPLYEDDDDAADTIISYTQIRQTETGLVEERYEEPLWPSSRAPIEAQDQPAPLWEPDPSNMPDQDSYLPFDEPEPPVTNTAKVYWH
jgi:hypothetical protein